MVLSVIVAPDDIGAAASKASKAESLLGKAGTFSKSIAISSAENVKNIVTLPGRLLYNIGNKAVDLGTIFSKGKGPVCDFTKSVVVSSAKNAKSLLTKVKGKLSDVGTVSSAFAKAFGKTYVKECSKYANTCFSISRATGAGLEAGYKGIVAGFKEAKSVLKVVKGEENGLVKMEGNSVELTAKDIPSAQSGQFNQFFNSLTTEELDELWKNKSIRKKIERELRAPGGLHEWHLVSQAPKFKYWDVSAEQIKDLRSVISDVKFKNPSGQHGGLGSTKAHNELISIIESSNDYNSFIRRLNNWANYRLEGGINSLPAGLRLE